MSEEEKEAIDKLKRSANYFVMPIYETTIILNLIEKQQKEIEKYKKVIDNRDFTWKQKYEETFEYVNKEFISKDKIREKIKELEDNMILFTNDKEKFNRYKYARDILEKLLEEK